MTLQDAKIVSSKFLQLKDSLEREILFNKQQFAPGLGNGYTDYTKEADIRSLVKAFGNLCELLDELAQKD